MRRQETTAALLLGIGAAYLGVAWTGVWPAPMLVVTALAAYGTVIAAVRLRVPVEVAGPVTAALFAAGFIALAASRTGSGAVETARNLVPVLLSHPYPAPSTVELIAPGAILVSLVAVGVAIRVVRADRTSRLAPAIAVATLYVAGATLSGGRGDPYGLVAAALLASAVADWLIEDPARPTGSEPEQERRPTSALLRLAASRSLPVLAPAVGVIVVTAALPAGPAFEPRAVLPRPVQVWAEPDPLGLLSSWTGDGGTVLLRVRAPEPVSLRLVALADYDGHVWSAQGPYTELGADDPTNRTLPPATHRSTVDIEVTVAAGLGGRWLPTPGLVNASSLTDALVQPASGVLARPGASEPGLRYRVRADVDDPSPEQLVLARAPGGPLVAGYLTVPDLPAGLADRARAAVAGATSPYERAVRVEQDVRSGRRVDVGAPAGSSYAQITAFLSGATGSSEQFASASAVLGRAVGLPTRVVVGFQPSERDGEGLWVVRGRDALAWAEFYLAGAGWVRFDSLPR